MTIRSAPLLALAFGLGGLAACDSIGQPFSGTEQSYAPVTTEEAFRAQVVGREVAYADGRIGSYGANTWTITEDGAVVASGNWEWSEGRWCFEGTSTTGPVLASCQAVEVSDASIRFTRADGSQGTLPFV
jgi:hypothetical protein